MPVQAEVLSQLQSVSDDYLVQAEPRTGKTLAFLLPVLEQLLRGRTESPKFVNTLIVTSNPKRATRVAELCNMLTELLLKRQDCHTAREGTCKTANVHKVSNEHEQDDGRRAADSGPPISTGFRFQCMGSLKAFHNSQFWSLVFVYGQRSILVATPKRLNKTVVLDAIDQLVEEGWLHDVKNILQSLSPKATGWQGISTSTTTVSDEYHVEILSVKDTFTSLLALLLKEYELKSTELKAVLFSPTKQGTVLFSELFAKAWLRK
ncbi:hypothetical protein H2199_006696 [Coniosporium tulheliwenetii]|uniref:Uncharacterized protein n=1 Tax=Coniosporium tulheliwenetii TaxID=3383036 RepID=A0ACC2YU82_9PEZI|nr:hypothetical protein H2199_006696 [Cladosporium sp. JES 115]